MTTAWMLYPFLPACRWPSLQSCSLPLLAIYDPSPFFLPPPAPYVIGCTSVAGYTVIANMDHMGDELPGMGEIPGSVYAAVAACNARPACVSFQYTRGQYWLKSQSYTTNYVQGFCFYAKIKKSSPPPPAARPPPPRPPPPNGEDCLYVAVHQEA